MGYFSADRVRCIYFFGVPLAFSAMYKGTSSVTAVAFDCFLAVFIQLEVAIGTLKQSMVFKIAWNNSRGTATSAIWKMPLYGVSGTIGTVAVG
ncbi:MAG: hypothetical protein LV481_02405 [Methylacidiphilales bacterium]|nr:hypothetical protein [Candidatus Methylacidiphilales bacterium]